MIMKITKPFPSCISHRFNSIVRMLVMRFDGHDKYLCRDKWHETSIDAEYISGVYRTSI